MLKAIKSIIRWERSILIIAFVVCSILTVVGSFIGAFGFSLGIFDKPNTLAHLKNGGAALIGVLVVGTAINFTVHIVALIVRFFVRPSH